jgi:hypothetical protein
MESRPLEALVLLDGVISEPKYRAGARDVKLIATDGQRLDRGRFLG